MSNADRDGKMGCSDCDSVSRRGFLKTTVGSAAAIAAASAGVLGVAGLSRNLMGEEAVAAVKPTSETLVAQLYKSLKAEQRKSICFPFDHPLRSDVDNNWFIIKDKRVKDSYDKDQQALIRDIFMSMHSEEYAPRVMEQVEPDNKDIG